MNTHKKTLIAACLLTFVTSITIIAPAAAQDATQTMDMPKHAEHGKHKKQEEATAPASTDSTTMPHSMYGMDMMSMQKKPHSVPAKPSKSAASQYHTRTQMPGMQMDPSEPEAPVEMQSLDFGQMIGVRPEPGGFAGTMDGMSSMDDMDMSSMQGGDAPEDARSPDYSDGYGHGVMPGMDMHDNPLIGMLLLEQLEYVRTDDATNAVAIDGQAWYGGNLNKLWLKFDGEYANDQLLELRTEALWSHAIAGYWDSQVGIRHDVGVGPDRTWAAFGIEGLAPYWFETQTTFYVGEGGRTAARVEFEYELLLTQRLILQPDLEANFYGKDDPQRGIGSGLSDIEAGLRLRYEIRREFAPYVGLVWWQKFGRTRDYANAQGEVADELELVAGFRIWF